jgi:hypothetical protein
VQKTLDGPAFLNAEGIEGNWNRRAKDL